MSSPLLAERSSRASPPAASAAATVALPRWCRSEFDRAVAGDGEPAGNDGGGEQAGVSGEALPKKKINMMELGFKKVAKAPAAAPQKTPVAQEREPERLKQHVTDEEFDAMGYPKMPEELRDPAYWEERMWQEQHDPRVNPNLLLTPQDNEREFWENAMRKPYAKYMLEHEQHWNSRRTVWLEQSRNVQEANQKREQVASAIEESCPPEVKRLIAPIMKYKITENVLCGYWYEAEKLKAPFRQIITADSALRHLSDIRKRIDLGGPSAAEELLVEYEKWTKAENAKSVEDKQEKKKKERLVTDTETLVKLMNDAARFKQDGLLEWNKGNFEEALKAWRIADEALAGRKARTKEETKEVIDLHSAVLKNSAMAAIKLELWSEALSAADDAIAISQDDHKAWFRRACALEGLGRVDEAEAALDRIDEVSVGMKDRERINKDTQAKREKIQQIRERDKAICKRAAQRALDRGLFSDGREAELQVLDDSQGQAKQLEAPKARGPIRWTVNEKNRKVLTREGAEELLEALKTAYSDTTLQQQVAKLAHDVKWDRQAFLTNMKKVTLDVQKPVLERWGFEPSKKGVTEMQMALMDHTQGKNADPKLKELSGEVIRILYGDMANIVWAPAKVVDGQVMNLSVNT
eukprot:gnl/TRDRNA2_/TRDRNA2_164794_c0_seq2.p1 gnl/TRDRNA2_/TRDRNA2_164794_c0~~gnl/TRDRNA2_/TRDRNA2_164794_c0_seq2.p1  ORF type:complete len:637 (+),score=190.35 gnl/TRDRNA2_/TRDRNA2_164794_c0_seq2:3-1913(+)